MPAAVIFYARFLWAMQADLRHPWKSRLGTPELTGAVLCLKVMSLTFWSRRGATPRCTGLRSSDDDRYL